MRREDLLGPRSRLRLGAVVPLLCLPALRVEVVTRPGRVEVYRSPGLRSWRKVACVEDCDHSLKAGVSGWSSKGWHHQVEWVPQWSWRFLAPNGKVISRGSESYNRLRDVARSLELAFPGYKLLDQTGCLTGPDWFLWGLEANWQDDDGSAYLTLPPGMTLGMGMRGVRIPVAVPAGVSLGSRR